MYYDLYFVKGLSGQSATEPLFSETRFFLSGTVLNWYPVFLSFPDHVLPRPLEESCVMETHFESSDMSDSHVAYCNKGSV